MADVKIANLTAKTTWTDTDLIIVEDGADTKKMTVATLKSLLANITGGQLKFPATQIPSTDANTLDDYEEGEFNSTDASGSALTFTYTKPGTYVKVGKMVVYNFDITYPTNADNGYAAINFPFQPEGDHAGVIGYHNVGTEVILYGVNFYNNAGTAYRNSGFSGKRITGTIAYRSV